MYNDAASNLVLQSTNEAHKADDGKARLDLIPPSTLIEIGKVLEFGAKKYGANNWRNGMDWSRFYGAALRHLFAWFGGETKDGESDLSHLAHAVCCLVFLMECEAKQIGHDDRLKSEVRNSKDKAIKAPSHKKKK
ncbi:dATP/dGTP diphosphohydrolase domain-containing protein [Bartonella machadoae]|uniref:dATP/dGTP diphosphohydrolase domain-containing protein n=1 Tax=Bartonella machadoae TaxID=2893471 RepID=UPI0027E38BCD|nr:dATP/dGTP diphosphohydrolase domain-containing protein [Bartonella machadoae]